MAYDGTETFEIGKHGEELRDEYKSKRFFEMLHAGRLDPKVEGAYKEAAKRKGTSRNDVTTIINRFLKRNSNTGKHELNVTDPIFSSNYERSSRGYHDAGHLGVIYEQAKQTCGDEQSLREAVSEGRVKTSGDPSNFRMQMFHFPQQKIGGRAESGWTSGVKLQKNIGTGEAQMIMNAVSAAIPDIRSEGMMPEPTGGLQHNRDATQIALPGGRQLQLLGGHAEVAETLSKLGDSQVLLVKQLQHCEKVSAAALGTSDLPERVQNSLVALTEAQQDATETSDNTKFMLKFNKAKETKNPITPTTALAQLDKNERAIDELAAACRVCKAHMLAATKA